MRSCDASHSGRWFPIIVSIAAVAFGCGSEDGITVPPTDGTLEVTASTSGTEVDPDGYTVMIDGEAMGTLTGSGPVTVPGLAASVHSVGLSGIAENCQVEGENPRTVTISSGATVSVAFAISCNAPSIGTGVIVVSTATSGSDPDPDGYLATLDGAGPGIPLATTGSASFPNVPVGSHTVALSGLAANCSVDSPSQTATVTAGATATVTFTVTCSAIPPATGSIRVTTTTTGSDLDPDGYRFAVDGGVRRSIGVNASETVPDLPPGTHRVVLSGVADNCSIAGGTSREVAVTPGATAEATFSITCSPARPSPSRSGMLADPKSMPTGGTSNITVTVRDASGNPMEGVPVTLSSSGSGNTITPESGTTDAGGVARFTFSSTDGGNKTITATAGGVTLEDTEVIAVLRRVSATEITSITPEPSESGENILVTVRVTGEGGGTPTGTVAIFSFQETGGCDFAPLDAQGIATCEFPLTLVGPQRIGASYSGDNQFEDSTDSDGQDHLVVPAATGVASGKQ